MTKFLGALSAAVLLPTVASAVTFVAASNYQSPSETQTVVTRIKSDTPEAAANNGIIRWTKDKVYILDRLTFVEDGVILIIEPGTIIRGEESTTGGTSTAQPADVGALIICRGSKIIANGTAQEPIIWTSIEDPHVPGGSTTVPADAQQDIAGVQALPGRDYTPNGPTSNNGQSIDARWGGLLMLGNAKVAFKRNTGSEAVVDPTAGDTTLAVGATYIEGFQSFQDGIYGGSNDDDNSGVVRFSSFRYGGFVLSPNNEINGLTLGGVGRGTVLEFVEIYNNADDDFEFFGGTVNGKYLAGLFGGDDGFDTDEGYRGNIQFGFQIQNNTGVRPAGGATGRPTGNIGDSLSENDGPSPIGGNPFSVWRRYNMTFVGVGQGGGTLKTNALGMNFKENAAGKTYNSILTESEDGGLAINGPNNAGTDVNDAASRVVVTRSAGGEYNLEDSIATAATEPDLIVKHTMFWKAGSTGASTAAQVMPEFTGSVSGRTGGANDLNKASSVRLVTETGVGQIGEGNTIGTDPLLAGIGRVNDGLLDPRLQAASTARASGADAANDTQVTGFFTSAAFKGAFKDNNWLKGWSHLENMNVLSATANTPEVVLSLGRNGSNPSVTFAVEAGKSYSVEKSTDQKSYVPISAGSISGSGTLFKGTVSSTGAGSVTVVDTTSTLAAGTPVYYRVIPQ